MVADVNGVVFGNKRFMPGDTVLALGISSLFPPHMKWTI
jgi:hypothetical protein